MIQVTRRAAIVRLLTHEQSQITWRPPLARCSLPSSQCKGTKHARQHSANVLAISLDDVREGKRTLHLR